MEFKKRSVDIIKLKSGDKFVGVFIEKKSREMLDKLKGSPTFGELKDVPELHFFKCSEDGQSTEHRAIIFGDAGLVNSIENASVKNGDTVMVVKGDKVEIDGGARNVNTYEIFVAE